MYMYIHRDPQMHFVHDCNNVMPFNHAQSVLYNILLPVVVKQKESH